MPEELDPKEIVSLEELFMSNVYTQEALINLLEKQGIITKAELLKEIKMLRDRQNKMKVRKRLFPKRISEIEKCQRGQSCKM